MAVTYLKKAEKTSSTGEQDVRDIVVNMLNELEKGGDERAVAYARDLDKWDGDIVITDETRERAKKMVSQKLQDDIRFAHDNVRRFAEAQRASMQDIETEVLPGLVAGHRNIPLQTAGCYVPGGRYAHIASAIMTATTARAAGVDNVIACSPPRGETGAHPAVIFALDVCGADTILNLGRSAQAG